MFSIWDAQTRAHIFFAHAVDANHFVARPLTVFQNDRAMREIQLVGQKTTQRCVSFSFYAGARNLILIAAPCSPATLSIFAFGTM